MKLISNNKSDSRFIFVDPVFILFLAMALIVIFLVVLPAEEEKIAAAPQVPGSMFVSVYWPPELPQDIDLWVQGPDNEPVGYSSARSPTFSYLRDDLGAGTYKEFNYEMAVAQNLFEGEYIINLHFYSYHEGEGNVPVEVSVVLNSSNQVSEVFHGTVTLEKVGDEITVVRFKIDKDGTLVQDSINKHFVSIRNRPKFEQ